MYLFILYSISKLTTANDVVVTELRIVSIKDQQFGDYTCEATNILGTTNATIRVAGNYTLFIIIK